MTTLKWLCCWLFFYSGDIASQIMVRRADDEKWCEFWYTIYNECMLLSSNIQDGAGRDPSKCADVTGWPWELIKDEKENKCP